MLSKTKKIIKRVAIFGDAEAKSTDQHFVDAFNTAKLLAENGYIIVNGGGPGVMLAATLGAKEASGRVEIVIIDPKKKPNNYEGFSKENHELADKTIKTKDYPNRMSKLIEVGDAFVIFNGGVGTLSEVGLAWQMAKFDYGKNEPLIFFGKQWEDLIEDLVIKLKFERMEKNLYEIVLTTEEVLTTIENRKGNGEEKKGELLRRIVKFFN
ncbi:MAG: LOG family protein [Candidatus Shapirobacteria bacterium]